MLLALLLASAGAGWVAVSTGLAGRLPSLAVPADQAAASWQDRTAGITEEASVFGRQPAEAGRGATSALGGGADSLATSAAPAAKRTIEAALDLLRDPRHGPMMLGGLGLAAGLAFGVLLGRRRGERARAQEAPTPASPPPPVRALPEPTPPPAPTTPATPAVAQVVPLATPLLAGTVVHDPFAAADPPPSPAAPTPEPAPPGWSPPRPSAPAVAVAPAEDHRAALIAAIVTIFDEEALRDSGTRAPANRGAWRRGPAGAD